MPGPISGPSPPLRACVSVCVCVRVCKWIWALFQTLCQHCPNMVPWCLVSGVGTRRRRYSAEVQMWHIAFPALFIPAGDIMACDRPCRLFVSLCGSWRFYIRQILFSNVTLCWCQARNINWGKKGIQLDWIKMTFCQLCLLFRRPHALP
jgi:hypothetical protein